MINAKSKTHGTRGAVALIIALLMVAFGVLSSMPAIAEEGGSVGQGQVSKNEGASHSDAKESEQEETPPAKQGGEDAKMDEEDEHADSLDGEKEKENSPPAGLGETVVRFFQSLLFGNGLRAESDDNIEFSGRIQWEDFDDLYGNRPDAVNVYVSYIAPDGHQAGYGGGIHSDASSGWSFSGSISRDLVKDDEVYVRVNQTGYEDLRLKVATDGETIYPCRLLTFHPHIQVRWNRADLYPPNPNTEIPFTICQPDNQAVLSYTGSILGTDCVATEDGPTNIHWDTDLEDLTWPIYINGVHSSLSYQFTPGDGVGYVNGLAFTEGDSVTPRGPNLGFYATAKRDIHVSVIWEDNDNANGNRPDGGYYWLYGNGEPVGYEHYIFSSIGWEQDTINLPVNNENGEPIEYTVGELYVYEYGDNGRVKKSPTGYTQETTGNMDDGFVITLREEVPETVDIPVEKRWNTEDDPYNNRPESITYKLYAISAPNIVEMNHYVSTLFCSTEPTLVMTQAASAADNYATTFSGMPATDEAGNELTYIVGEEPVPGFYTVDGAYKNDEGIYEIDTWRVFDGTNPVTIWNSAYELRTFKITKIWDDKGHEDERPESVTINLLADGEVVDSLTLSEANIYTTTHDDVPGFNPDPAYAWSNYLRDEDGKDKRLPSYRNGREIEYTLEEEAVDGYESVMGDAMPYWGPKGALPLSLSITNAYTGASSEASEMRRTIKVHKTWDDAGYEDERPESVTIRIYADGEEADVAELNEKNGWSHVFAGVLEHEDGGLVEYQVTEDPVDGYETSVEIGTEIETSYPHYVFTITNTRIKEPVVEAPKPKDEEPAKPKDEEPAKPKDEEQPVIKKIVELVPTGGVSVLAVVACVALVSAIGVFVTRSKAGR